MRAAVAVATAAVAAASYAVAVRGVKLGDPCTDSIDLHSDEPGTHCGGKFACVNTACAPLRKIGERCVHDFDCAGWDTLCMEGLCSALRKVGEECYNNEFNCADANPCVDMNEGVDGKPERYVCVEYTTLGNKCKNEFDDCQGVFCSDSTEADNRFCKRYSAKGEACAGIGRCYGKLQCCSESFSLSIDCPVMDVCTDVGPTGDAAAATTAAATAAATAPPEVATATPEVQATENGTAVGAANGNVKDTGAGEKKKGGGVSQEVLGSLIGGGMAISATFIAAILSRRQWRKREAGKHADECSAVAPAVV
jgi:hypothetical protein